MKEMSKLCSTDQRFILKEISSYQIHTLKTDLHKRIKIDKKCRYHHLFCIKKISQFANLENKQTLFSGKSSVVLRMLFSERISTHIRAWLSCCLYYNPEVCTAVLETTSSAVFILG